jgi:hypothetical protein
MTDVLGSDQNLVTRISDRGRTGCQDDVGVQGIGRCGWNAELAGVRPKERGLAPSRARDGLVRQSSNCDEIIETTE